MIDTDKYEGHTKGKWEYDSATIHATAKGGNEIIAEYPCWNYNKDQLITEEEETNLRLMADAPLLLEEVKRLREEKTFLWETYLKESAEVKRLHKGIKEAIQHLTYPAKYDKEVQEQTDKLKELIG